MKTRRDELRELNKETLIDNLLLLEGRMKVLEQQVRDLRQLRQLPPAPASRPVKTPENSSLPSGQSNKAALKRRLKGKRGPKPGHVGRSRSNQLPDEVLECRASRCADCGHSLAEVAQEVFGSRQVIDILPMQYVVREARSYGCRCPQCGQEQSGVYPVGFEAERTFGERLQQVALYLHHAHPLSYQRVQHILHDLYGLPVSLGGLVNLVQRSAPLIQRAAESIRQQVQCAAVVGSDETPARVDGKRYWQWVFQTPQWVYMRIHARRAGMVIKAVLEAAQPEVWVSDLGSMQLEHPAQAMQVCLAHQVRDLQYAIDSDRCGWAYRLQTLLYRAMRLGQRRDELRTEHYQQQVQAVERHLDDLLKQYPNHPDSQRLHRRYSKHRASLLVFLQRADVPPTNNASEQALRNSVIYRKVTGGFRTPHGATLYADLVSILESARRQHRSFFDILAAILSGQSTFFPLRE